MLSISYFTRKKDERSYDLQGMYSHRCYFNRGTLNIVALNLLKRGGFVVVYEHDHGYTQSNEKYCLTLENGKFKRTSLTDCVEFGKIFFREF